jgi:anhydro-N-acetylmuramic acid kinase
VWTLRRRLEEGQALVAGVLSGTSGDGIDVVLASPSVTSGGEEGQVRLLACPARRFETLPFPSPLAPRVRAALDGEVLDARGVALLSRDLGIAFGEAVREVADRLGETVDLVGSHGLTVYHHDGDRESGPASLQLGDGDFLAEAVGSAVVSDFRARDLAAGGIGAPISVLADDIVFAGAPRPTLILNLGGMANLSWLPDRGDPLAFDTGPAGSLLDGLSRRLLGSRFDAGGGTALRGTIREGLLERWLDHPFFRLPPPKSTGRDTFGEAWIDGLLEENLASSAPPEDLLATAVELIAIAVEEGVRRGLPELPGEVWVAGGGGHNRALMAALRRRLGLPVLRSSGAGVDPDAREALVFAILAVRALLGEGVTRSSVTGARGGRILGKITPPGR